MVIGHEKEDVMINGLIDCLAQFEAIRPEDYCVTSLFTLQMFGRGSQIREQVLCVVQRTRDISELPALQRIRTGSQHAPCTETSVERRRASIRAGA